MWITIFGINTQIVVYLHNKQNKMKTYTTQLAKKFGTKCIWITKDPITKRIEQTNYNHDMKEEAILKIEKPLYKFTIKNKKK